MRWTNRGSLAALYFEVCTSTSWLCMFRHWVLHSQQISSTSTLSPSPYIYHLDVCSFRVDSCRLVTTPTRNSQCYFLTGVFFVEQHDYTSDAAVALILTGVCETHARLVDASVNRRPQSQGFNLEDRRRQADTGVCFKASLHCVRGRVSNCERGGGEGGGAGA